MKNFVLILILLGIAAGGYFYYTNSQSPAEPQPVDNQAIEVAPEPTPEPEVVVPEPIPEPALPEITHEQRAAEAFTTLTDKQGREIKAKVLAVADEHIKLRREDGLETSIPISMLSEADIAFCEYLREKIPQLAEVPTPASIKPQSNLDPKALEAQGGIDWDAIFGE